MSDEMKMLFKEAIYAVMWNVDDIGHQTEWLTKQLCKVDRRSKKTAWLLVTAIIGGIGYILKNENDKAELEVKLKQLEDKGAKEEDVIF